MVVGNTSVNDADLDALAEDALLVELVDTGSDVRRVLNGLGVVAEALVDLKGRQVDLLVEPDVLDLRQPQEGVQVVGLGLDADAGEDVRLECLDDSDVVGGLEAGLAPAQRALVRISGGSRPRSLT